MGDLINAGDDPDYGYLAELAQLQMYCSLRSRMSR